MFVPTPDLYFDTFMYLLTARLCGFMSSCGERRLRSGCGTWASHCSGFSRCGAQALGEWASVVMAHGLRLRLRAQTQ